MAEDTGLSVVIAGYTTERLIDIHDALDSMRTQTYRGIEVVFVVDGSADLLQKMQQVSKEIRDLDLCIAFSDGEPGLSRARNIGVSVATGDVIAFIDDDAIALPDWAEQTVKTFEDSSVIGVTGPFCPPTQISVPLAAPRVGAASRNWRCAPWTDTKTKH